MAKRRLVPTSEVRAWAYSDAGQAVLSAANAPTPGPRGRVHPETVAAFRKANKHLDYAEKVSEAKTLTLRVPFTDKAGRNTSKAVKVPVSEIREIGQSIGVAKDTGRFSAEALSAIAKAYPQA